MATGTPSIQLSTDDNTDLWICNEHHDWARVPEHSYWSSVHTLPVLVCVLSEAELETRILVKAISWEVTPEGSTSRSVGKGKGRKSIKSTEEAMFYCEQLEFIATGNPYGRECKTLLEVIPPEGYLSSSFPTLVDWGLLLGGQEALISLLI